MVFDAKLKERINK